MVSAAITADRFCSAGYLAMTFSILASASLLNMLCSPIDLAEHDVLSSDYGHHVGDHVPPCHLVDGGEMREPRSADLQPIGLVGTIRNEVNPKLALGGLYRSVGLAFGDVDALGEELEMMDQL